MLFFFSSVVDVLVTGMQPSWNEVSEIYFNLQGDHEGWPCICIRQFVFSYPLSIWLYLPDGNQLPLNVCDFTQLLFSILVFSRQKLYLGIESILACFWATYQGPCFKKSDKGRKWSWNPFSRDSKQSRYPGSFFFSFFKIIYHLSFMSSLFLFSFSF